MDKATRETLVEGNLALLKEADAERDTIDEVGRGRDAEQANQVQLTHVTLSPSLRFTACVASSRQTFPPTYGVDYIECLV